MSVLEAVDPVADVAVCEVMLDCAKVRPAISAATNTTRLAISKRAVKLNVSLEVLCVERIIRSPKTDTIVWVSSAGLVPLECLVG